jgi:hypothetical protein
MLLRSATVDMHVPMFQSCTLLSRHCMILWLLQPPHSLDSIFSDNLYPQLSVVLAGSGRTKPSYTTCTALRCRRAMRCWAPAILQLRLHNTLLARSASTNYGLADIRRCRSTVGHRRQALAMTAHAASASPAAAPAQRSDHVSAAIMPLDGFLQRVADCNCSAADIAQLVPFVIDTGSGARTLGRLTPG